MRPDTLNKYAKVKHLIDEGWTQTDALAKVGMAAPTYRQVKNDRSLVPVIPKKEEKEAQYIDIVAKDDHNIMIVVCKTDQIRTILGELK